LSLCVHEREAPSASLTIGDAFKGFHKRERFSLTGRLTACIVKSGHGLLQRTCDTLQALTQ
ncbi:hypothetical protein, partial [Methylobacterium sp. WL30]|uniref:hypothetical protein n=1 Tax=Methylobacterium sp. WL30 TaxID=2603895 RepID=UPI001AEED5FE